MLNNKLNRAAVFPSILKIIKYIILYSFGVICLYPFIWVFISSFKDNDEIYSRPFMLPQKWEFINYLEVWVSADIGINFFNSMFIATISVAIVVLISAMVAYVIARVYTSKLLYIFFTLGIMLPTHTMLIPTFNIIKKMGLINSMAGLILVYVGGHISLCVFILVAFIKTLPIELEESAFLDGCSRYRTFFTIILPLSKPGIATVSTLSFLFFWNEYLFSLVIISSPKLKTLTQAIADLKGVYFTEYGLLCAGLMISIIPVLIMYILFQEQVIKGMTAGAVKG